MENLDELYEEGKALEQETPYDEAEIGEEQDATDEWIDHGSVDNGDEDY